MSVAQVKSKQKSKKTHSPHHRASNGTMASGASRTSSSRLGAFYSAGPVFGLAAPVQTKLTIGRANDPYEREADAVADHVMSGRPAPAISPIPPGGLSGAQMASSEAEEPQPQLVQPMEEEETPQPQLIQRMEEEETPQPMLVQRMEEEETPQPMLVQRMEEEETPQPMLAQRMEEEETPQPMLAQRMEEEEEPVQKRQQKAAHRGPHSFANAASRAIRNKGAGTPLNPTVQRRLESGMGVDLSQVREPHGENAAHDATSALKARAFTHRNHIWLGRGESQNDARLMAHEATHVAQQRAAPALSRSAPAERAANSPLVQRAPAAQERKQPPN